MKRYLPVFLFLPASIFLFAYSWAQELPEIIIEDADATTTIDLATPPADFFVVNEPPFLLPDEVAINKQTDLLIKEIQIAQRQKKITAAAAQSLIEKLGYIKIQL